MGFFGIKQPQMGGSRAVMVVVRCGGPLSLSTTESCHTRNNNTHWILPGQVSPDGGFIRVLKPVKINPSSAAR